MHSLCIWPELLRGKYSTWVVWLRGKEPCLYDLGCLAADMAALAFVDFICMRLKLVCSFFSCCTVDSIKTSDILCQAFITLLELALA